MTKEWLIHETYDALFEYRCDTAVPYHHIMSVRHDMSQIYLLPILYRIIRYGFFHNRIAMGSLSQFIYFFGVIIIKLI
jgi:hypothetical protein